MKAAQRLLDDPRLATLFAALSKTGAETRVVGGAVRDAMLGLPPHEIDLATTALPDAVLAAARDAGLKGVPTGIEHGTVTIVVACMVGSFDISTPILPSAGLRVSAAPAA